MKTKCLIAPFKPAHLRAVTQIEKGLFGSDAYSQKDFESFLAEKNTRAIVALEETNVPNAKQIVVAGYLIYDQCDCGCKIANIHTVCVDYPFQMQGIGSQMVRHVMSRPRIASVQIGLRDDAEDAHGLFRSLKFKATKLKRKGKKLPNDLYFLEWKK